MSMHKLLAERKAAIQKQSQPSESETTKDQLNSKPIKGYKRR